MRDLHLRCWVWLQNVVERTERHETELEHATNELLLELPHLSEQVPHLVAVIFH